MTETSFAKRLTAWLSNNEAETVGIWVNDLRTLLAVAEAAQAVSDDEHLDPPTIEARQKLIALDEALAALYGRAPVGHPKGEKQ